MAHLGATYPLSSIVDRAIKELEKKVKQWRGVENESSSLQEDLNRLVAQMDSYLKGWRRDPRNPVARVDFEVMRDLVHDMEDCIEGFLYEIKHEKKKEGGLDGVIPDVWHWGKKMGARDRFSKKIRKIKKRAEEASNRRRGDLAAAVPAPAPVEHQRDPVAEDNPVGIAMAMKDLCTFLDGEPKQLRVISIVGFGGSGKTTLARAVYRSLTDGARRRFPLHAWVDRADYSNPHELLRCIIQRFWGDVTQSTNQRELQGYIRQHLRRQRYLIVLDDMEDTDPNFWGWIQSAFIDNCTSSRIVVTTSRLSIGQQYSRSYGNGFVYKMRTIGNRACKELAFPGHRAPDDPASPEQMLLKICDGLPLALVSVANDFRSTAYDAIIRDRCEILCREFGSLLLEEATEMNQIAFANLRGVLMDHYVGLPGTTTRSCLLYLGLFSDGRQLKKNKITRRWVAEGYAETSDPQRREEIASGIFEKLIDQSFIHPNGISSSSHTYRALGVVQEFVRHRSSSDRFMMHNSPQQLPAASNGIKKVRHIFVENFNDENRTTLDDVDLGRVRSLTVSGSARGYISKFKKSKLMLMRVLDLENCTDVLLASHLQDICKHLRNLRYLSLGSNIEKLPKEITQLDLLESLHLSKRVVIELPVEVIAMPCLIVLIGKFKLPYMDDDEDKQRHAIELSQKSKLQTLAGFDADGQMGFLLLMPRMKNLKKVKIWCNSSGNIGNLHTQLLQAIQMYTTTTTQLQNRSLCIRFEGWTPNDLAVNINSFFQETTNINYLSSLKLHGNLPAMPQFVTTLKDLAEVCLQLTNVTNDVLSTMGRLQYLVRLKLVADSMVAVADVITIREGFQSLTSLCFVIHGNDEVPEIHVQAGALQELVSLQLLYIMGPAGFSGIRYLTKLREIELHPGIGGPERREFEKAAQNHPNRPIILPFLSVDDPDVQVHPRPLIAQAQRIYGFLDCWLHPRNFSI